MKPVLRVVELDHVVLRCRDIQKMLEFYCSVLGLREERRLEELGLIQLRAGQSMVDLVPGRGEVSDATANNVDHFCLGVETEDAGAMASWLRAQGVEVLGDPQMRYGARGMGYSIYIRDPEGNVIELKRIEPTGS